MTAPITERHRPTTLSGVQGHNTLIKDLKAWAKAWKPGTRGYLLVGDAGIGKTTIAHALAADMDWDVIEVNASSARRKADIERLVSQVSSGSATGEQRLLFLDECDSLDGRSLGPLIDLLGEPPVPIIAAANEKWKVPSPVESRLNTETMSLGKRSIKAYLKKVAAKEGIELTPQDLGKLATRGNLRSALADLDQYRDGDIDWDDRWLDVGNFETVDNVLQGKRMVGDMTPDELVIWLDENLSAGYRLLEAGMAYDALSRADVWLGRARSTGDYRWWRYAAELAKRTADCRRSEPYEGWVDKSFPAYYRQKTSTADDGSPEAALYTALKDREGGSYRFAGNYPTFKATVLPLLCDLPEAVRLRLALDSGIGTDEAALKALGLTPDRFEKWLSG